jgi:hypothetical protein
VPVKPLAQDTGRGHQCPYTKGTKATHPMTYLETNLLPLVLSITPKQTESHILAALGLSDRVSQQSILIAFGERIEQFWNQVISDCSNAVNLIESSNLIDVNGRQRQIDHLFSIDDWIYYLESKCNLNFDSEKVRASNEKVNAIADTIGGDISAAYFVPVVATVSNTEKKKYANKGMNVWGVNDLLEFIDAPFTSEEYFTFLREVVAPILEEKGL